MTRSDTPFTDDPLAGDTLLAELRAARPEAPAALLDPRAPANVALVDAIVGDEVGSHPRRPRRRRILIRAAAVATVAAAVAGVVVVWPFGSAEPSAADVVRRAVAASESALDSGRALVTVKTVVEMDDQGDVAGPLDDSSESTYEYRLAGDDVAVVMELGSYPGERRVVDGEMYWHAGPDPSTPWFHDVDGGPVRSDWTGDPRSLLATLEPRAGFELVGDDTVDGVEVDHLRARTPAYYDPQQLGLGQALDPAAGVLTGLDVWVDGDGVVRRIDLEATHGFDVNVVEVPGGPETIRSGTEVTTASVRFVDIGVPNTVEAPAEFCEVTDEMMANPPPPGADVC